MTFAGFRLECKAKMQLPDQSQFHKNLSKKAFEVGYALFRIASPVEKKGFADHIENNALRLLSASSNKNHEEAIHAINGIEHLLILAGDANIVKQEVCDFVIGEVKTLYSAIAEYQKMKKLPDIDLKGVFTPMPDFRNVVVKEPIQAIYQKPSQTVEAPSVQEDAAGIEIRQSKILEKIRLFHCCLLRLTLPSPFECSPHIMGYF